MAQDFHAAFDLGTDERHIATVDADGVALAAIQG
jgi:trimeric autotransporter adhesin